VEGVRVRLVQPSIPQRDKWRPERQREFFYKHLALSGVAPDGQVDDLAGITHVVWPEAAMPFGPLRSPEAMALIGERLGPNRYLLAGALRSTNENGRVQAFNSLIVFTSNGAPTLYDKIHLVPFGEYLPFQETLESIGLEQLTRVRGGFSIGTRPRPLMDIPGLPPVGPLICYEAIFPAQVVQSQTRPGVLVNVTNDGWFGITTGPHQHFQQARARAVEEGLHLLRVANNGISASIDPYGRVLAKIELNAEGTIDGMISKPLTLPVYAQAGDIVFLIMSVCVFLTLIVGRNMNPRTCSPYSG
jgi:apolipoprotein N-acyltransferase